MCRERLWNWFVFVQLKWLGERVDAEAHAGNPGVHLHDCELLVCARSRGHRLRGGNAEAWRRMPGASCNDTLTSLLFPLPIRCHASLSPPLASAWLVSIPLLTFWPRIPFFCFKAGSRLHYSIFIFPSSLFLFTQLCPQKKSCLSLAWWIIIPSSVSPCQSINLTCHLLSFLSSSVKGWPPLLSLYLSVSLCVQIPRLSPPDWIIQFRCHLFHSWQWGLCALSSV